MWVDFDVVVVIWFLFGMVNFFVEWYWLGGVEDVDVFVCDVFIVVFDGFCMC